MKKWKGMQYVLHAAVLGGLIYAGTKHIQGDQFVKALRQFDWAYAPFICLLGLLSVLIKGWRFTQMMRELKDTSRTMLLKAYVAGQACALLPGGGAARAGMLKQAGIPAAQTAAPLAMASFTDQAMFLICSLIAAFWFESARRPILVFLGVLTIISLVLGIEASRTWVLGIIDRLMGKLNWREHWQEFIASMKQVASPSMLLGSLGNTALAFLCLLVALHLTLRGVSAEVTYPTLLLAFALPTMLGRISAMPGGVGVTEAGMIGILDNSAGVTLDQAAAAVTIFRLGTILFPAIVGGMVYFFGWRGAKEKAYAVQDKEDADHAPQGYPA